MISVATLLFTAIAVLIRTPVYLLSLLGSDIDTRGRLLIAWFGPRGLSSLLLILLPVFAGVPGSEQLFAVCSLVVLVSVVLHGGSPTLLARIARKRAMRQGAVFAIESLSGSATSSGQTATMPTITSPESGAAIGLLRWFSNARAAWIVAAVFAVGLLATFSLLFFNRSETNTRAVRLSFTPPPDLAFNDTLPDAAVISPDGQKIAFTAVSADGKTMLYVRDLDSSEVKLLPGSENAIEPFWSPDSKQVVPDNGAFVYAPPGWLIFIRNDALVAQAFDAGKLELSGEPIPIITGQQNELGSKRFSVSDNGVLVWQGQWHRDYQLVWFDREGKQTGAVDALMKVSVGQDPYLSPDGKRLVVKRDSNLWVIDLEKGTGLRITSTFSQIPVWSPDGNRIAYNSGNGGLAVKAANGLGAEETLLPGANFPAAWSPDGRFIIYIRRGVKTRFDMWVFPMFGDRKEFELSTSPFDEQMPQFSPDRRWLAYTSDETGNYEIYVQSFSADGKLGSDKKRVSTSGGRFPVWRRDGSELFYIAADGQMMSSAVKTGGSEFEFSVPKPLFKTRMLAWTTNFHEYDVSPDGQRFLIGTLIGDTKAAPPTVILNWTAELKK